MKTYPLRVHPHTRDVLAALSDEEIVRLAIGPNPEVRFAKQTKSEHSACRVVVIPDELLEPFEEARDAVPIGYAIGDVLDRLCGAPPDARLKNWTTVVLHLTPETANALNAFSRRGISKGKVLEKAVRDDTLVPTPEAFGQELRRVIVGCPKQVLDAFREASWLRVEHNARIKAALAALGPEDYSETIKPRIMLPRKLARALRGLTHIYSMTKEEIVMGGLLRTSGRVDDFKDKYTAVSFDFNLPTSRMLEATGRPNDAVATAIAAAAEGNEAEALRIANEQGKSWRNPLAPRFPSPAREDEIMRTFGQKNA